ncbi:glucosaminidase domain-containing protein [Mesorhizobium sp. M0118]|uniref:glycoside hydrolase family 73 protein n=1 Tax=Mesorhizobium sp. M0118 TaxID=2956884 RepID=UPI00333612F1
MATIPLQLAQRRLDTGNAAQYPQGLPIGGAMQDLGGELSAVAERFQQRKEQQEAFDTEIARRRMMDQIVQAEADVAANAAPDGAGLHDAMYGQVDPRNGRVVKPGLFDTLFDDALPKIPESQRADFARQKKTLRETGSLRMAARQLQRRKDYEQNQWSEVQRVELDAIAQSNPNDAVAFEAARRRGLDILDRMGLEPQGKLQAEAAWRESTAKTRIEAVIAANPIKALNLLNRTAFAADANSGTEHNTDGISSGSAAPASGSDGLTTKDDLAKRLTPDERVGQAFQDDLPTDALLADLSPSAVDDLVQGAHAANAESLVNAGVNVDIASQNARAAVADRATYSGGRPGPEQFAAVFGVEEAGKQFETFKGGAGNFGADLLAAKGNRKKFVNAFYQAGKSAGLTDTQARLMATQAAHESGSGKHAPGFNYFGIKAGKSWKGETQRLWTHEEINGRSVRVKQVFRKYATPDEGIRDRIAFMQRRFGKANDATDIDSALAELQHGKFGAYATDSNYAGKLRPYLKELR